MINQDQVTSTLRLNKVFFEKINLQSKGTLVKGKEEANISFCLHDPVINESSLIVALTCIINIGKDTKIEIKIVGDFTMQDNTDPTLFIPNAIAIIFPYLRAEVSLITAQPNFRTIVLPAININMLLQEDAKQKSESKQEDNE